MLSVLEHFLCRKGYGGYGDEETQNSTSQSLRDQSPPRRSRPPPTRNTPHTHKPDVTLREGPSIRTSYEKDKVMLETKEELDDQPDAFGGPGYQLTPQAEPRQTQEEQPSKQR